MISSKKGSYAVNEVQSREVVEIRSVTRVKVRRESSSSHSSLSDAEE
jgi:hypothetical protein